MKAIKSIKVIIISLVNTLVFLSQYLFVINLFNFLERLSSFS